MSAPIIVEGVTVSYNRKQVLQNVYVQFDEGQLVGVLGPNGAGKSTLFKAILGLLQPDSGSISIFGDGLAGQRKRIAYVPQKDEVDWSFPATVEDIVLMGRYPGKKLWQAISKNDHELANKAMEELRITDFKNRQIGALSGGQQQRVFLARAICQEADILMLDEPFVGVDITTEEHIIKLLHDLAEQGKTILVVHHDLSTVPQYFDQVLLLNQRIMAFGDVETTFTQENIARTYGGQHAFLFEAGPFDRE